jgi:NhaP-type Na+/H+ or K+/H+ antiporter
MLLSVGLIMISGLIAGYLLSRIGLPYIIGMLISGALLGPHVLRKIALIIILT